MIKVRSRGFRNKEHFANAIYFTIILAASISTLQELFVEYHPHKKGMRHLFSFAKTIQRFFFLFRIRKLTTSNPV